MMIRAICWLLAATLAHAGEGEFRKWSSTRGSGIVARVEVVERDRLKLVKEDGAVVEVRNADLIEADRRLAEELFRRGNPLAVAIKESSPTTFGIVKEMLPGIAKAGGWQIEFADLAAGEEAGKELAPLKAESLAALAPRSKMRFVVIEVRPRVLGGDRQEKWALAWLEECVAVARKAGVEPLLVDPYYRESQDWYGESGGKLSPAKLDDLQASIRAKTGDLKVVPVRAVLGKIRTEAKQRWKDSNWIDLEILSSAVTYTTITGQPPILTGEADGPSKGADPFASQGGYLDGCTAAEKTEIGRRIYEETRKLTLKK